MKVLLAAGGTGGHLVPGLVLSQVLRARGHTVHGVVPSRDPGEARMLAAGFGVSSFFFRGFPRRWGKEILTFPLVMVSGCAAARRILRRENPAVVVGMGGYVSVPVGLAALWARVPTLIHEQNAAAGLANRLLSLWASKTAVTFEHTRGLLSRRQVWTGLPLRRQLTPRDRKISLGQLGLAEGKTTLLVFGGSQGAQGLNRRVVQALPLLQTQRDRFQWIHLTGTTGVEEMRAAYTQGSWSAAVFPFYEDMATAYSAADFVVARSGAGTVMELARFGKRALLVPYPFATDDHQSANAQWLVGLGRAEMVRENTLTPERLARLLSELPAGESLRAQSAQWLAEALPLPVNSAEKLADEVERLAKNKSRG